MEGNPPVSPRTDDPIAFPGAPGAHSERAIRTIFGPDPETLPSPGFTDVADAVLSGRARMGILPMEITLAGNLSEAYDALGHERITVLAEVAIPVKHSLVGLPAAQVDGLTKVLSHPIALAQCQRFFRENPTLEASATWDAGGAARKVAERGDPRLAALAPPEAAEVYGLRVLAKDLQDRVQAQARYFLIGRTGEPPPSLPGAGGEQTALVVEIADRPGSLVAVLTPFARHGVNLGRIQARPSPETGGYRFFLELDAGASGGATAKAIQETRALARELRILGSYPSWKAE